MDDLVVVDVLHPPLCKAAEIPVLRSGPVPVVVPNQGLLLGVGRHPCSSIWCPISVHSTRMMSRSEDTRTPVSFSIRRSTASTTGSSPPPTMSDRLLGSYLSGVHERCFERQLAPSFSATSSFSVVAGRTHLFQRW